MRRLAIWGQRSRDEMGDLWIQVLTRNDRDLEALARAFRPKMLAEDVFGYEGEIRRNPASVALHERVGFSKVAHFKQVGYKFGQWIDVGYWQTSP